MNAKVIEILTDRIEALEWILKIKEEEIERLEIELAEYKKAELAAVGFGEDGVIGCK